MKALLFSFLLLAGAAPMTQLGSDSASSETQALSTVVTPDSCTYRDWCDSCGVWYRTYYYYDSCGRYTGSRTVRL